MRYVFYLGISSLLARAGLAASSSACSGQQYNDLPGFPASRSGCYPLNYYQTYDLGNTNPDDARTRCEQYCTSDGNKCKSVVAQVNKAADSNLYSGTCFLYAPGQTVTPRQCANTAYLLEGYYKDNTLNCFQSSSVAATKYCSSYLGIPSKTSTVTTTPKPVTTTTTLVTSTTVTTTFTTSNVPTTVATSTVTTTVTANGGTITMTSTVTTTTTTSSTLAAKRAVSTVAAPACVTSGTPASRLSAACSCLNIPTGTTTATITLTPVTSTVSTTSTNTITSTVTTDISPDYVTATSTSTVTTTTTGTVTTTVTMTSTVTNVVPTGAFALMLTNPTNGGSTSSPYGYLYGSEDPYNVGFTNNLASAARFTYNSNTGELISADAATSGFMAYYNPTGSNALDIGSSDGASSNGHSSQLSCTIDATLTLHCPFNSSPGLFLTCNGLLYFYYKASCPFGSTAFQYSVTLVPV